MLIYVALGLAAFIGAFISGVIGMAGGMLMLAVVLTFLSHGEAIPLHAFVQLFSNGTRVLVFLRNVDWPTLGRFSLGAAPGMVAGMFLLRAVGEADEAEPWLKMLIGAYILAATYLPKPKKRGGGAGHWWDFVGLGLMAGVASLTIGAVGPLIGPMFIRRDFVKERLIATKAVCQLVTHVAKIPVFLALRDLDVSRLGSIALVMILLAVPGTILGKRVVGLVREHHFVIAYRIGLTIAGLKVLLVDGAWGLLNPQ